jgi:hypothetical protein
MKNRIVSKPLEPERSRVVYSTAASTQAGNDVDWIECLIEDQSGPECWEQPLVVQGGPRQIAPGGGGGAVTIIIQVH